MVNKDYQWQTDTVLFPITAGRQLHKPDSKVSKKTKANASDSYVACLTGTKPDQPRFTIIGSGSWSARVNGAAVLMRPSIERATNNWTRDSS